MPVINGVYLKDFPALPGAVEDANIIPIAITGNQISYRTTVSGIVTDARVTGKLLTGLSVTGGAVVATDTILQAFGKVQNQINGKQETITLTTLGTSGEATLIGSTLNIPNYADGGVLSVGAIGASPNANAATITGTVLNLEPASASFGGVVTTGTQAFAGFKTFGNSGSDNTVNIDHTSGAGIGLTITKGGNGEGLIVNKTGGTGNAVTVTGGTTSLQDLSGTSATFTGALTGTSATFSSDVVTSAPFTSKRNGTNSGVPMLNMQTAAGINQAAWGFIGDGTSGNPLNDIALFLYNDVGASTGQGIRFNRNTLVTTIGGSLTGTSASFSSTVTASGGFVGNASTATTLASTRTIWGQNFNGSANVSGALTEVTGITTSGAYTQSGTTANTFTGAITSTSTLFNRGQVAFGTYDGVDVGFESTYALTLGGENNSLYTTADALIGGKIQAHSFIPTSSSVPTNGMYLSAANTLDFATNSTNRLKITSDGNVGIGTSNPLVELEVRGSGSLVRFGNTGGGYLEFTDNQMSAKTSADAANDLYLNISGGNTFLNRDSGEVRVSGTTDNGAYNLQVNGTGVWGAGAYVNGSDLRLKNSITPLNNSIDLINKMKPVTYKFNEDYSKDQSIQTGFIAQDLQEILKNEAYLDGIVKDGSEYLSVAYQNIIPLLVKAVQELSAEIKELKTK
jgi:hypothetical protein